ncbi:MAG: DNA cytosine methyltransferase [Clostridiales bacterium]|nr:DNA cytosine methyltransferase [Clostridiales bacterium]
MTGLVVDNFAGGGGASTGIEMAIGRSVDIAINHDPDAIAMHRANHPATRHYCEDVWQVDPVAACAGVPVALAWFSPDCTHFSRAKGGKPVDKNIRGLAWVTVKWAALVRPAVIMLENVPEIRTWGPLGADGKPIKERAGETFMGFILALTGGIPAWHPAYQEMCDALSIEPTSEMAQKLQKGLGYKVQHRTLKSCDYGAPTTRTRFYLIARCDGRPIVWAEPTHAPKDSEAVKQGLKLPYHTAAECIDWSIPAQSIFERKKPLAENTMRRIARGIQKFVIDNPEPFIVTVNHSGEGFRGQSTDEPLGTITAKNGYGVVTPTIMCNNTNNVGASVETPLPTVTTENRNYLVAPSIVPIGYGEREGQAPRVNKVDEPLGTVVTSGKHYLVAPTLIQYHSETAKDEVRGQELTEPLMTQDTSNRYALSVAHIMKNYGGGYNGAGSAADAPLDTVTAKDHNSLVTAHIMTMRNNMDGQPIDEPLTTISCSGAHHAEVQAFLVKYFSTGAAKPVDEPLDTVTTKDRFALVTIHGEQYIITDIKMRMLQPRELFNAQGFPRNYVIDHDADGHPYGKSKQVARCGNAVTPPVPAALVRANLPEMCKGVSA